MIDFLKKCGISSATLDEILKVNVDANIYNFSCNQDEVVKIIEFLKNIGIKEIDALLIHKIDLFFMTLDDIMLMFNKNDINLVVKKINEDYLYIDNLL